MSSRKKVCESMDVTEAESIECINDCTIDEDPKPKLPLTRSEILDAVTMVRTVEDSKRIVKHLMECHQIVAIDVKGRDLGKRNGKISLIAVGTCNGQCLLFDIHYNSQLVLKGRLKYLLQCNELIKVMHGCNLIRVALEQCYGVKVRSIFDTQVAHAVIEGHRCGKNPRCVPCETPLFISYTYGRCVSTPAAHALEKLYLENCNFWDIRPLPCKQKEYAARGVLALVPEAYNNLNRRLQGPLRKTFRTMCQGKCIELADSESVQGQGTSFVGDRYQTCSSKRSLSADRLCRSGSTSSSSIQSERNSSRFSPTSPPRKREKRVARFSVSPRKSVSVSSCGSKKRRLVLRKMTKPTCTGKPAASCGPRKRTRTDSDEICNCKRLKSVTTRISLPRNKRSATKSTSSAFVNCKRKNSEPICKRKRSSCTSLSCASTSKPKFLVRHCSKNKACPRTSSSRVRACPKKKACPRTSSSRVRACPKKKACPRRSLSRVRACPKKKACPRRSSSRVRACPKKKACPRRSSPGKKLCVKPKIKQKCTSVKRNVPCQKSSTCLCKTLGRKDEVPMKCSNLVERGWKTAKSMDLDSDENESMDTDDDDEDDFENEMKPPAAKRKR